MLIGYSHWSSHCFEHLIFESPFLAQVTKYASVHAITILSLTVEFSTLVELNKISSYVRLSVYVYGLRCCVIGLCVWLCLY